MNIVCNFKVAITPDIVFPSQEKQDAGESCIMRSMIRSRRKRWVGHIARTGV
jgi:hypothetical protein